MTTATSHYERVWTSPTGWRSIAAVNHKEVGRRFVKTGFVFFLVGGVLALLMRVQLGSAENTFLDPETYNQLFTMHGTTMMFLFAVPFMEGVASYLLPLMLGTRDLPFPRFNAFNYWCYLFGGILLYASFLGDAAPDGGWFGYTPLTSAEFSPGLNIDIWLIGITLVEISGIGAAAEILVSILRTRAPGMTLMRMPIFAWAMLVVSVMILFAFTTLATASIMLELDRKFAAGFYDHESGGSPILWQHLFWIFGHPEVYIMFLPAAGIVSQVIQTFTRRSLVGYGWVVFAIITTGFLSFGLWAHHMFTVGLPSMTMTFFAAASLVIGIASGIQVVSWIATLWRGDPRYSTALLFALGFIVTFVIGGVTGIMVASVPFDWQVHDTHFVVAHFHYVLLGGVVFPAFAGIYYWFPKLTGRLLDERLGRWNFWLMFIGFNVTFLPMHLTGLWGMPRRVYTYSLSDGWQGLNFVSTIGSFLIAAGVAVFVVNYAASRRAAAGGNDPWHGDTLEWSTSSPPPPFNFRELPRVGSRHPGWEDSDADTGRGSELLRTVDHEQPWRLAVATSPVEADPEHVTLLPQPTFIPLYVAVGVTAAGTSLLIDNLILAGAGVIITLVALVVWWVMNERAHEAVVDGLGASAVMPDPAQTVGAWGLKLSMAVLATVVATAAFSYLYIAVQSSAGWPLHPAQDPPLLLPAIITLLAVISAGAARMFRSTLVKSGGARGMWIATVSAIALSALTVIEVATGDNALGENAYGSLVALLLGSVVAVALVAIAASLWALVGTRGAGRRIRRHGLTATAAGTFYFLAVTTVGVMLVYVSPSLT